MLNIKNDAGNFNLTYKMMNDVIYFKAKEIATILGYKNTAQAIMIHVDDVYKTKLKDISSNLEIRLLAGSDHNIVYVNEYGLYQLVSNQTNK